MGFTPLDESLVAGTPIDYPSLIRAMVLLNGLSGAVDGDLAVWDDAGQALTPVDLAATLAAPIADAIAVAVNALVDGAPGALDTLNELAAAVNDDASFAAAVTAALALKAPLASPSLTGTPAAPTAAQGTNTTQVATTAYVQTEAALLVLKSLFDANTVLAATSDNTPAPLTVAASTFVGRKATGDIAAMSVAEAAVLLATTLAADAAFTGPFLAKVAAGAAVENVGAIESNVSTVAATGAAETLDTSLFGVFDMTMDQACTFTFANPAPSGKATVFMLILRGAFTPTWPASVDWGDATPPTYTTPSQYVFTTVDAGTTWLGVQTAKALG